MREDEDRAEAELEQRREQVAEAGVDAQVGLDAQLLAVAQELVGAEAVGFDRAPGVVAPRRALVARTDAVQPVIAGGEVASSADY